VALTQTFIATEDLGSNIVTVAKLALALDLNDASRTVQVKNLDASSVGTQVVNKNALDGVRTAGEAALAAEIARATAAEAALQIAINAEESARIAAVSAEAAARGAADVTLQSNIDAEVSARIAAVSAEATARAAADTAEASARAAADATLQSNITAEESARIAADSAEATARAAADATLQTAIDAEVSARVAAVSAEATARGAADAALQSNIDAEASARIAADSAEATARAAADATLTTNLANEVTRAMAAEAALQTALDAEVAARGVAVTAEATARAAADVALQSNIDAEAAARAAADTTLTNALAAEVARALAEEADIRADFAAADTNLDTTLRAYVNTQVSAEAAARAAADAGLASDIAAEVARATAAEASLQANIDAGLQGLDVKESVSSRAEMPGAFVPADLTGLSLDGKSYVVGQRVLVTAPAAVMGIWDVKSGAWTRSVDADSTPLSGELNVGAFTFVESDSTGWVLGAGGTWTQFSGSGTYTAGNAIAFAGTQINVNANVDEFMFDAATKALLVKELSGSKLANSSVAVSKLGTDVLKRLGQFDAEICEKVAGAPKRDFLLPGTVFADMVHGSMVVFVNGIKRRNASLFTDGDYGVINDGGAAKVRFGYDIPVGAEFSVLFAKSSM
jgi:hypothetical protein